MTTFFIRHICINHSISLIFRTLIENFSAAYHSKVLTVPLDWLKDILFYSSIDQLANDLKYYGLTVDTQLKSTRFQQESFQASKPLVSFHCSTNMSPQIDGSNLDLVTHLICFTLFYQLLIYLWFWFRWRREENTSPMRNWNHQSKIFFYSMIKLIEAVFYWWKTTEIVYKLLWILFLYFTKIVFK